MNQKNSIGLNKCFLDYKEQFPFLKTFASKTSIGPFNIQKYSAGDHFSRLHCERTSMSTLHRLFAWMTYLNDVDDEDGGTTDFDYYKIKVKPECGKTLIWPAEWTHAHYGSILKKNDLVNIEIDILSKYVRNYFNEKK